MVSRRAKRLIQTKITKRGQTVVPAPIRKRYGIQEGDRLVWLDDGETIKVWLDDGETIKVIPIPSDPVEALRGSGEGENLLAALLRSRAEERERE
jgi:AbrB family looped-hinge helix DNA binding protein